MIKRVLATTAVAASDVGISATVAPQAMAIGNRSTQVKGDQAPSPILGDIPVLSGSGVHNR
ncbi:hypothetical protein AB0D04_30885 [Streptomyces sp. NPDC048483]|uniref:hypothetical protein n=1 Tax=Streptomyces sp. NPDC048483 TaxID=3154927 RepID=UPI00344233FB